MKMIILAAGRGKRLRSLAKHNPKPMLRLSDGTTPLARHITLAAEVPEISGITIVTGFMHEQIETYIKQFSCDFDIDTVYNPFFECAGPVVSLWVASRIIQDHDVIIANGDTLYAKDVYSLAATVAHRDESVLFVSRSTRPTKDDVKVIVRDDKIVDIGKDFVVGQTDVVSAGFLVLRGRGRMFMLKEIDAFIRDPSNLDRIWHDLIRSIAKKDVSVRARLIARSLWHEIDEPQDVLDAERKLRARMF